MKLKTNRGLLKLILLSIVTLGIYELVFCHDLGKDVNAIYEKDGGKKQMGFLAAFFLGFITFGITLIVWSIKILTRVYDKAAERKLQVKGSVAWVLIASLLLGWTVVCPLIAMSQFLKATNAVCEDFNNRALGAPAQEAPKAEEAPAE